MSGVGLQLLYAAAICFAAFTLSTEACDSVDYLPSVASTVRSLGFPAKTYNVTTSDGYVLTLTRIPGTSSDTSDKKKPAILLMHGLASNGATYLLHKKQSLPFLLVEKGFDVWFGSIRGNSGNSHVSLSNTSEKYWDFSWHEHGVYDLPAIISFIKSTTGQARVQYVGHSMGTTMLLVMCSMKPRRCEQDLLGAYLLAPVAYLGHSKGALNALGEFIEKPVIFEVLAGLEEIFQHGAIAVSSTASRSTAVPFCSSALGWRLCLDALEAVVGSGESGSASKQGVSDLFCLSTDNISWKQLFHFAQNIVHDNFRQYIYKNPLKNLIKYGLLFTAPPYPLEEISTPVSLYYGTTDYLVQPADVLDAVARLSSIKRIRKVQADKFSHLDFLYGKKAKTLVYQQIVSDVLEDRESILTHNENM